MLRNMKGPLAGQAAWTDGRSSSDVRGEAPAEGMNHHSTNCSSQRVYRIHLLFSLPDKKVVKKTMLHQLHDGVMLQTSKMTAHLSYV